MLELRYLKRFIDETTGNKHWETVLQFRLSHYYEWKDVPIVEQEIKSLNKVGCGDGDTYIVR